MISVEEYKSYKPLKIWIIRNLDSLYFHAISLKFASCGIGTLAVEFDMDFDCERLDFEIEHIKYSRRFNHFFIYFDD